MFISVKEAMELTGMSSTTIYRLCNKRINTLYVRKEDNKFLIDKEFILATYPPDVVKNTEPTEPENLITAVKIEPKIEFIVEHPDSKSIIMMDTDENSEINNEFVPVVNKEKSIEPETNLIPENIEKPAIKIFTKESDITENVVNDKSLIEKLEAKTEQIKSPKKINWEAIIGIALSIVAISVLIYFISLDLK